MNHSPLNLSLCCLPPAPWQSRHVLPASTPGDTEINSHVGIEVGSSIAFQEKDKKRNLQPCQMKTIQHFPELSVTIMLFTMALMSLFTLTRIRSFEIANCHSFTNSLETEPAHAFAAVSQPTVYLITGKLFCGWHQVSIAGKHPHKMKCGCRQRSTKLMQG